MNFICLVNRKVVEIVNVMKYKQPPYLTDQRRVNFYCSIGDVKVSGKCYL